MWDVSTEIGKCVRIPKIDSAQFCVNMTSRVGRFDWAAQIRIWTRPDVTVRDARATSPPPGAPRVCTAPRDATSSTITAASPVCWTKLLRLLEARNLKCKGWINPYRNGRRGENRLGKCNEYSAHSWSDRPTFLVSLSGVSVGLQWPCIIRRRQTPQK